MTSSTTAGLAGATGKIYNAAIARMFPALRHPPSAASHLTRIPFRLPPAKASSTSQSTASSAQDSISGLRFCLHMVVFAAPGIILSKKLCDGERLEDIIQNAQDTVSALINKPV